MKTMLCIQNVDILTPEPWGKGCVVLREGRIAGLSQRVDPLPEMEVIDGQGLTLAPGFIDLHVHGGGGYGVMGGSPEEIRRMCAAHARHGTTSILPTTLAAPLPELAKAVDAVRAAQEDCPCCNILGIHLEGPFLSPRQSGAQNPENLLTYAGHDGEARELLDRWKGIRMVGAAPELPGGLELGREVARRGIVASAAHTDADYDTMQAALACGYQDITHLYSGCSTVIRRDGYRIPGVVEAGLELEDYTVQVIADGKHLPPALLRLIYRCKGATRIELISDGLEYAAGELAEGALYRQANGMEALYEDGVMKLPDRQAFAGSVATSSRLVRTMRDAGIPLCDGVRMASLTPAQRLGIGDRKGRIAPGYDGDVILFDQEISVRLCVTGGRIVRREGL